jgi:4a-hydroxytetrahydrobiopterin dehydratase
VQTAETIEKMRVAGRRGLPARPTHTVNRSSSARRSGTGSRNRTGTIRNCLYGDVMTDVAMISGRQFLESAGVQDWRVIWGGGWACACFRTGSFEAGIALVERIGALATITRRPPDVDLRPDTVTVRLFSGTWGELSQHDVGVARQISLAARELGARPDPGLVQHVQVAIDATSPATVRPYWRAVLGYQEVGAEDVFDPLRRGPSFWFQDMDVPRPQRNRLHIDIYLPHDQVRARIDAALAAGGRIVSDARAPHWWTLADPEGNEVDLAIWMMGPDGLDTVTA